MTPSQLDHLRRIDAHLANLLATAEKRTPGEWEYSKSSSGLSAVFPGNMDVSSHAVAMLQLSRYDEKVTLPNASNNANFIASCAGNAEAGWKATRLAIKTLLEYTGPLTPQIEREYAKEKLGEIIALFPNA